MTPLYDVKPKRLFAFGCSFTQYHWPCWPEIVGYQLQIPTYNLGKSGSGNQCIFSQIIQSDNIFQFTNEDLIMVSWTNVCREDRFIYHPVNTVAYLSPGNIFTQNLFDEAYVKKWAIPEGFLLRDLVSIKSVMGFLDNIGVQQHHFSMCDFVTFDQYNIIKTIKPKFLSFFDSTLEKMLPSMYKVLWNNNFNNKKDLPHAEAWNDLHPTIKEHYKYLKGVFDYDWSVDSFVNEFDKKVRNAISIGLSNGIKYPLMDFSDCHWTNTNLSDRDFLVK